MKGNKAPRLAKTFAWTRPEGKVTEVVRHQDEAPTALHEVWGLEGKDRPREATRLTDCGPFSLEGPAPCLLAGMKKMPLDVGEGLLVLRFP